MTVPCQEACSPWATVEQACSPCTSEYGIDMTEFESWINIASDTLFEWSGRQFAGHCRDVVRPCSREIDPMAVHRVGNSWSSWSGLLCGCGGASTCGCPAVDGITLGAYPLVTILEVQVADDSNPDWLAGAGTAVLHSDYYRIDDWRYLVRLPNPDGRNPGWPCCQRIDLPAGAQDTFQVEFTYGKPPPALGTEAAVALACDLYLACHPDVAEKCKLPKKVANVARQGVSLNMFEQLRYLKESLTGTVPIVDLFIRTYNPSKKRRPSGVLSPDIGSRVTRAGT